jgi:hypothetical protein
MSKVHEICRHWFRHSFLFVLEVWFIPQGPEAAGRTFGGGGQWGSVTLEKAVGIMAPPETARDDRLAGEMKGYSRDIFILQRYQLRNIR